MRLPTSRSCSASTPTRSHLGPHPGDTSAASRRHLGDTSATLRRHLGDISATSRRHLGGISATLRRHLGDTSAASRRHLGGISHCWSLLRRRQHCRPPFARETLCACPTASREQAPPARLLSPPPPPAGLRASARVRRATVGPRAVRARADALPLPAARQRGRGVAGGGGGRDAADRPAKSLTKRSEGEEVDHPAVPAQTGGRRGRAGQLTRRGVSVTRVARSLCVKAEAPQSQTVRWTAGVGGPFPFIHWGVLNAKRRQHRCLERVHSTDTPAPLPPPLFLRSPCWRRCCSEHRGESHSCVEP